MKTTLFLAFLTVVTVSAHAADPGAPEAPSSASTPTYSRDIQPLFAQRCVMCHNGQSPTPNWMSYVTAFQFRTLIQQRVSVDRTMPLGNVTGMTDPERALVSQWVQAGAPQDDAPGPLPSPSPTPSAPPALTRAPTFASPISSILQERCVVCHNGQGALPGWAKYDTAYAYRDLIYQHVVVGKTMPLSNITQMTDQERQWVAEWVHAGAPKGTVTFAANMYPIFERRCATCHNGQGPRPNWLNYDTALLYIDLIYQRVVVDQTMPLLNQTDRPMRMTDDERAQVADWVKSGAKKGESTYIGTAYPIFKQRCALCHDGQGPLVSWLSYENAVLFKDQIFRHVLVDRTMPLLNQTDRTMRMSDGERMRIGEWLDQGTPRADIVPDP